MFKKVLVFDCDYRVDEVLRYIAIGHKDMIFLKKLTDLCTVAIVDDGVVVIREFLEFSYLLIVNRKHPNAVQPSHDND